MGTPTYKGAKKAKKLSKKEQELKKKEEEADALKALSSEMSNVQIAQPAPTESKQEDEPVLIVKKRQWIAEGKKQESILISICNHFRKEIGEKFKKVTTKIKNANKLREQKVFNPSLNSIASL